MSRRKVFGFTTVELLIVMVVIAILASIALPQYNSHLRKSRRSQAQAFMLDMASREQQYFTDMRSYAVDVGSTKAYTTLNITPATDVTKFYTITTTTRAGAATTTPSFTITATAIGDQVNDKQSGYTIKALTIDDTGAKMTVDSGGTARSGVAW